MNAFERCKKFMLENGWHIDNNEFGFDDELDGVEFHKDGCCSVYFDEDEMTFIDDQGDFNSQKINYYTLIGVLLENKQICINYISVRQVK